MKKHVKILLLTISILFISVHFIYPKADQYKFRNLTTKQGLPSNLVNSIAKGNDGFMLESKSMEFGVRSLELPQPLLHFHNHRIRITATGEHNNHDLQPPWRAG